MTLTPRRPPLLLALPTLFTLFTFPSALLAHRLDEYLQATLVVIEPGDLRLRINLTPGVAVAEQVLARIDPDDDGVISTNEASAYAERLKHDLHVRLDQRDLDLQLSASHFSGLTDLRSGLGIIQIEFSLSPNELNQGTHKLTLENQHLPAVSVYLLNAALPKSETIQITGQKRNDNQSEGEIEFTYQPLANSPKVLGIVAWLAVPLAVVSLGLWRMVVRMPSRRNTV